jgi:hypothetical protein
MGGDAMAVFPGRGATVGPILLLVLWLPAPVAAAGSAAAPDDKKGEAAQDEGDLAMTDGIVCETIGGYRKYAERPGAALVKDEKMLVYYEPFGYTIERDDKGYRAHLTQDAFVRRKGGKVPLWGKKKIVDYEVRNPQPPTTLYLSNTISLKGLPPGEYELDIVLHDELGKGGRATQTVKFRVKSAPEPETKTDPAKEEKEDPPGR